jgi:hypothetical protein
MNHRARGLLTSVLFSVLSSNGSMMASRGDARRERRKMKQQVAVMSEKVQWARVCESTY